MAIANDITSALARPQTLVDDWPQLAHSDDWAPGDEIGPYRLKQRLGKGGMGVVWLAEQLQPLQREVAIKVMAGERRDAWAETWFEIERQALAQLSHRGIAQIFDAGRLPDGALFFAMEYVPGVPLDEFQQADPLDPRALAALFVQICAAVQHAHQRGLIHRDLKPLNVLVQPLDGEPVAKIIDFGIAVRALPGVATPFRIDRVVGTPAYMSPEQKQPGSGGIDARCDIYALGVMLGEAMCRAGGPPADRASIDVTAVHDAVALELGRHADERSVAADVLRARLKRAPRELLAIALKAMSADRDARYESAAAMAEDLGRWLARRPVQAVGGGRWYAFRCLIRRNRIASLAAALVMAAILGGSALAWAGMREAQRAQALAEQRRDDAEKLIQFMLGDFADKLRPIGRLDLLDSIGQEALRYLSARDVGGDPASALSRARALRTLGEVQVTRQQFEQAELALRQADQLLAPFLRESHVEPDVLFELAQITYYLGSIRYRAKDLVSTRAAWQEYLRLAQQYAASAADPLRGQKEVAYALSNLGTLALESGDPEGALAYFESVIGLREKLAAGEGDTIVLDLANSHSWAASALGEMGRTPEAHAQASRALQLVLKYALSDPQNAQRRRLEVNFRLMLAQWDVDFGNTEAAREGLEAAYRLVQQDVANDPSQPRRQAMLVRVALMLARLSQAERGEQLRKAADATLRLLNSGQISQAEWISLDGLACVAAAEAGWHACVAPTFENTMAHIESSEPSWELLDRATELALALPPSKAEGHLDAFGRLSSAYQRLGESATRKLRYRLRLRDLLMRFSPQAPRIEELSQAISRDVGTRQEE